MKTVAFHLNCLAHGGAERVVSILANRFAAAGYRVLVATEWQEEIEYALSPQVERIHVGLRAEDEGKGRVTKFLLRIRYLRAFMKTYRPDVLVAFAQRALYRALEACGGTGVPVVIAPRIHPVGNYDHLSDRIQMALFFHRTVGAVFQTEEMQAFFAPHLKGVETKVILNPVSAQFTGRAFQAPVRKEVVHSARLVDFKNQPLLVRAFVRVHERHPDYVLKIFGADGGEGTEAKIRAEIAAHNAQDYILLMGESAALERDLPGAACFAYASDYEGMPNALIEAMVLGLPVVSTDCPPGGPRALITDRENGLLVKVGDEAALAQAICDMIEHPDAAERMGRAAARLIERTGEEAIFGEWESYLQKVTADTGRAKI